MAHPHRSLLQLLTLTAAAAVFTETAQAAVYQAPDLSRPLEGRIQALRQGAWQPLLQGNPSADDSQGPVARYWGNGGGRAWGNGGGGWRNGGWGNGGRYYGWGNGIGWPNGGWGNGGGWGNALPGGFINW